MTKVRRRYLALEIEAEKMPNSKDFIDAVWDAVLKLYGEYGASHVNLTLIDYVMENGFAIIRTTHMAIDMVKTSLVTITEIGDKPVAIHILRVSGTIKTLREKTAKQPL